MFIRMNLDTLYGCGDEQQTVKPFAWLMRMELQQPAQRGARRGKGACSQHWCPLHGYGSGFVFTLEATTWTKASAMWLLSCVERAVLFAIWEPVLMKISLRETSRHMDPICNQWWEYTGQPALWCLSIHLFSRYLQIIESSRPKWS